MCPARWGAISPGQRERCADEADGSGKIAADERRRNAHHPPARAEQVHIAGRIEPSTAGVHPTVDLDDEPRRAAGEVSNVTPDDDLPPKRDPEAATAELSPQELLGARWMLPQMVSPSLELELTLCGLTMLIGRRHMTSTPTSSWPDSPYPAQDL